MLENRWARDETLNKVAVAGLMGQKICRANGASSLARNISGRIGRKVSCLLWLNGQLLPPLTASQ